MSQKTRDWLLLMGLSLAVNGIVAALVSQPGYTDAFYYFNGGNAIAEGRGWVEPYLWNYVYATGSLPVPAFGFWQPLASLVAAAGIVALPFLPPFDAAQAAFVLVAALLPVMAYQVAIQLGKRRHALLAGLLAVFSGFYAYVWSLPETFTPFAVSAAAALMLVGSGMRSHRRRTWILAGVCAALANLTRADGLLVIGVIVIIAVLMPLPLRPRFVFVGLSLAGYCLVMTAWWWRNLITFGSLQAPGGLNALWLVEYNDLFNYPPDITAARFFAAGWEAIVRARWEAIATNLASFVAVVNLVFLTPLTAVSLWRRWRSESLMPAALYGVLLFAAMTFAFPQVGARGGFFHSAGALLPFVFAAAVLGLDDVLHWAAARRGWNFRISSRVFGAGLMVMAALLTGYVIAIRVVGLPLSGAITYNNSNAVYVDIGAELSRLGVSPDAPIMSNDPPGFYFFTGHGGIPLPNGDEVTLLRAADEYGVDFLVVDRNVPDGLIPLFEKGPPSARLELIRVFEGDKGAVSLYYIRP